MIHPRNPAGRRLSFSAGMGQTGVTGTEFRANRGLADYRRTAHIFAIVEISTLDNAREPEAVDNRLLFGGIEDLLRQAKCLYIPWRKQTEVSPLWDLARRLHHLRQN
jgi:hypothetical protein